MAVSKRRLLITGAGGFIGRHMPALMAEAGFEVHLAGRRPLSLAGVYHSHQLDLHDAPATARLLANLRPSHLLHLAWYVEHGKFWDAAANVQWVESSLRLVRHFAETGGERLIVAGTCAEYQWVDQSLLDETTTPLVPASYYGLSKASLFQLLAGFADRMDLSFAWGRIFWLFGPHENPARLVASVITSLLAGRPALCTPGEQIRDYLSVLDAASAFAALTSSKVTGAVNISDGKGIAVSALVTRVGELIGRPELVQLGARPAAAGEPPLLIGAAKRMHQEVGWHPERTLDERLGETIQWWQEYGDA
jgi:nucleoside-diphosphate-sugar epimerase